MMMNDDDDLVHCQIEERAEEELVGTRAARGKGGLTNQTAKKTPNSKRICMATTMAQQKLIPQIWIFLMENNENNFLIAKKINDLWFFRILFSNKIFNNK